MNPKASLLSLLLTCASTFAGIAMDPTPSPFRTPFDSILPWRGISNTVFATSDSSARDFQIRASASGCGGVLIIGADAWWPRNFPFKANIYSLPNANSELAKALWESKAPNSNSQLPAKAIVRSNNGASKQSASINGTPARSGQKVSQGLAVKTQTSPLDLFLGDNGPFLRVHENTEVEVTRLTLHRTGVEKVIDTRLDLRVGRISGAVKKLAAQSTYMVRTRSNLIRIRGAEYEIHADGSCAIITGFAEIITPTHIHTVNAGEKYDPPQASLTNR